MFKHDSDEKGTAGRIVGRGSVVEVIECQKDRYVVFDHEQQELRQFVETSNRLEF